ncbi:aspartate/glutamate racemase family protein [Paenibacillus terreus]|uniref:Aspartate/glutamate racemase family protein n=1 Tax=Paenibacillus terreus TaxID=1387834 RepID=A0ABV5B9W9_9BACL
MKTIGLIGGMSWESSALYYQIINQCVKEKLGGHHSAKSLMYSVDFQEIKELQHQNRWDEAANILIHGARSLQAGGADCIVICTNTMHKLADEVSEAVEIPLLHIAEPTARLIVQAGIKKVALLGTRFTMEQEFYKAKLTEDYGLQVLIPNEADRQSVHDIIYNELCLGQVRAESKQVYLDIIGRLVQEGAEAVILGCTEITLLIQQADCPIPVYDTTRIHAEAAVEFAVG